MDAALSSRSCYSTAALKTRKPLKEFLTGQALSEDPFELKDMEAAVARINDAIAEREPIAVYGDFDADGVCATALMTQTLGALGGDVTPYIPDRADEGYGLNAPALEKLARRGIKLLVTVDCGIRSVAEVAAGTLAGLDIIVTDHHSVGPELPAALAVINPQQEDCAGEARLAGVGVAFMLAKALLLHRWATQKGPLPRRFSTIGPAGSGRSRHRRRCGSAQCRLESAAGETRIGNDQ